jgi:hypothetical protein
MRSRVRRAGMAAAAIALLTAALVGCQPSASGSPDGSIPSESITLDSFPPEPGTSPEATESPEPSETPES